MSKRAEKTKRSRGVENQSIIKKGRNAKKYNKKEKTEKKEKQKRKSQNTREKRYSVIFACVPTP